jgi:phage terminase large subunit-like protein
MSIAQRIALLPPDARAEALAGVDPAAMAQDWRVWARPSQIAPEGAWTLWLYMAGRGSGKTRAASEWVHERVRAGRARQIALLARTAADVRDVMILGSSGLIKTARPGEEPLWEPSKRRLTWPNGAFALAGSADEPDQFRGPEFDCGWTDELAAHPQIVGVDGASAFDNLRLGLRLPVPGDMPRMIATTTPRRVPSMKKLLEEAKHPEFGIVITRSTTYDNLPNLAGSFRATILGLYEGTRLGRQELMGEMLEDAEGILFQQRLLDETRVTGLPDARMTAVVGVDPSTAERPGDECGIVAVLSTQEKHFHLRHLYVVEDASVQASPSVWAQRVVDTAHKWRAPVVAEGNQGGDLVRMAIAQVDPNVRVYIVHARQGKAVRAEAVAAVVEQRRLHIVGTLSRLEAEVTSWSPMENLRSPGRLDAMVWAATSLAVRDKQTGFAYGGTLRARSTQRKIPVERLNRRLAGAFRLPR